MEYVIRQGVQVVSYHELREAFPDNYIPASPTPEYLDALGVDVVAETFPPVYTETQKAVRNGVVFVEGQYRMVWEIVDLTEQEIEEKNPVPQKVTRRQALQALLIDGLLADVPSKIAAIPDPLQRGLAEIEWNEATEFERTRPLVIAVGTALGLDASGLDALFRKAGKL